MSFVAKLQRAREVLEQQGRLSVRALGRELELGGDELAEIVEELVDVQRVARREENTLKWSGNAATESRGAQAATSSPARQPLSYTPKHLAENIRTSLSP